MPILASRTSALCFLFYSHLCPDLHLLTFPHFTEIPFDSFFVHTVFLQAFLLFSLFFFFLYHSLLPPPYIFFPFPLLPHLFLNLLLFLAALTVFCCKFHQFLVLLHYAIFLIFCHFCCSLFFSPSSCSLPLAANPERGRPFCGG